MGRGREFIKLTPTMCQTQCYTLDILLHNRPRGGVRSLVPRSDPHFTLRKWGLVEVKANLPQRQIHQGGKQVEFGP